MRVLITGGTGVNGAVLARLLLSEGDRPVLFDNRMDFSLIADIKDKVDLVEGDREVGVGNIAFEGNVDVDEGEVFIRQHGLELRDVDVGVRAAGNGDYLACHRGGLGRGWAAAGHEQQREGEQPNEWVEMDILHKPDCIRNRAN